MRFYLKKGETSPKVKGLYVESPEFNPQHGKKRLPVFYIYITKPRAFGSSFGILSIHS